MDTGQGGIHVGLQLPLVVLQGTVVRGGLLLHGHQTLSHLSLLLLQLPLNLLEVGLTAGLNALTTHSMINTHPLTYLSNHKELKNVSRYLYRGDDDVFL